MQHQSSAALNGKAKSGDFHAEKWYTEMEGFQAVVQAYITWLLDVRNFFSRICLLLLNNY
jgi:hypothetical protein